MEDNKNRSDKTLGELTVKDVIVIGAALYTIRFCGRVLTRSIAPSLVKSANRIVAKTEALKAEQANRK